MIKYFCDRCGKDLSGEKKIGYIAINSRAEADGDLRDDNDFEHCHYCAKCTDDIKAFVRESPGNIQTDEGKSQEVDDKSQEDGVKKKRTKIDTGKVLALKKAGWSVKAIADEMHLTPQQVSNQLYLHKDQLNSV